MLLAFHKPYGVLSQFTAEAAGQKTLAEFGFPPDVYAVGRLDQDSEGLLLLTDERQLVDRLLNPNRGHPRTYAAQVEGIPNVEALEQLARGVVIQGRRTLPCRAWPLEPPPAFPPRLPPIRTRLAIPTCWIALELAEGKNRQVRRMTAAVGYPTLRLVRIQIGRLVLGSLPSGQWRELNAQERLQALSGNSALSS